MHFLVRLGIEVAHDSFGLNIVEYMGPQVVLGEIPTLVRYIDALCRVCLPKSEVSSQKKQWVMSIAPELAC